MDNIHIDRFNCTVNLVAFEEGPLYGILTFVYGILTSMYGCIGNAQFLCMHFLAYKYGVVGDGR